MTEMAAMGQIETHQTVMRTHQGLVDLEVGWATTQTLHIDPPLLRIEVESAEGAGLACQLNGVNMLVPAVVTSPRVAFRILVAHGRTQRIVDGSRCDIFRRNEDDGLPLTLDLFFLSFHPPGSPGVSGQRGGAMQVTKRVSDWERTIISAISGSLSTRDFSRSCCERKSEYARLYIFGSQ